MVAVHLLVHHAVGMVHGPQNGLGLVDTLALAIRLLCFVSFWVCIWHIALKRFSVDVDRITALGSVSISGFKHSFDYIL